MPAGLMHFKVKGTQHHYSWNKPHTIIHNLIFGSLWADHVSLLSVQWNILVVHVLSFVHLIVCTTRTHTHTHTHSHTCVYHRLVHTLLVWRPSPLLGLLSLPRLYNSSCQGTLNSLFYKLLKLVRGLPEVIDKGLS